MELSDKEFKAHLAAYSKCDIEGGTASSDRMLFRAGYAAGVEYYRDGFYTLLAALRPFAALWRPAMADMPDDKPIWQLNESTIMVGDVKAARAAIAKVEGGE